MLKTEEDFTRRAVQAVRSLLERAELEQVLGVELYEIIGVPDKELGHTEYLGHFVVTLQRPGSHADKYECSVELFSIEQNEIGIKDAATGLKIPINISVLLFNMYVCALEVEL